MIRALRRTFAINKYANTPTVAIEYVDGKKHVYDSAFEKYNAFVKAYLEKRCVKKSEICALSRAKNVHSSTSRRF